MSPLHKIKRPWEIKKDYNIPGQGRDVVTSFYHSSVWKKLRNIFIGSYSTHLPGLKKHHNKFCWICALDGIYRLTHTIDHLKPINREKPFDTKNEKFGEPLKWENLGPLCLRHANMKNSIERNFINLTIEQMIKKLRIKEY